MLQWVIKHVQTNISCLYLDLSVLFWGKTIFPINYGWLWKLYKVKMRRFDPTLEIILKSVWFEAESHVTWPRYGVRCYNTELLLWILRYVHCNTDIFFQWRIAWDTTDIKCRILPTTMLDPKSRIHIIKSTFQTLNLLCNSQLDFHGEVSSSTWIESCYYHA